MKQNSPDVESNSPENRVARRRLLQGAASLPLVMSITSRPAWAGGNRCSPSALASADLSGRHDFEGCGKSAGYWRNKQHLWPMNISPSDDFVSIFGAVTYNGKVLYEGSSLGDVILLSGNSRGGGNLMNLGLPLVGAYVNANAFPPDDGRPGFPYTATEIVDMYRQLADVSAIGGDEAVRKAAEDLKDTLDAANNMYDGLTNWP